MAKPNSKMLTGNQDFTPKFLQFSRLLSKEKNSSSSTIGDSSFRVAYYGGAAGSVPFLWESQPGTPKHICSDTPLPPLTPPPSYRICSYSNIFMQQKNSIKNSKTFSSIIPRISSKKVNILLSFSSSSSCSSSSYSAPSTPMSWPSYIQKHPKANSISAIWFGQYEDVEGAISPTSTLCFGSRTNRSSSKFRRHYYPMKSVKRAFLSIVGHAN